MEVPDKVIVLLSAIRFQLRLQTQKPFPTL
jgi:hypothetical protein